MTITINLPDDLVAWAHNRAVKMGYREDLAEQWIHHLLESDRQEQQEPRAAFYGSGVRQHRNGKDEP